VTVQLVPNAGEPVVLAVLLLIASVTHMLQVFTLGPADLGALGSGYPANMFALPMPTRALVGWPMLYGAAVHVALWLIVVYVVLVPAGFSPPVWWPAAGIAAFTTWVQAIGWSPSPIPFARVPMMAVAMIPVVSLGVWAGVRLESRTVASLVVAGTAVWIACAYVFAVHGLSRARCGTEPAWAVSDAIRGVLASWRFADTHVLSPFRSAAAAQLWHECRRNATYLPAMLLFLGLPLLVLNCFAVLNPDSNRTLLFGSISVSPAVMSLLIWVAIPLLLSISLGQGLGKLDFWGTEAIPSFFAVRPMTTWQFIALKLAAAAVGALICWVIVMLFLTVWAFVEASSLNPHPSIVRSAIADLTFRNAALACLVLLGLIAATWRTIVIGMWPGLTGRKWISVALGVAMFGQLTIAVLAAGWIYRHPEIQNRLVPAVPWLLGGLFAFKLCGAAGAVAALRQLQIANPRTIATILGCWIVSVIGILTALSTLVPVSWQIVTVAFLCLPLVRILAAPLALYINRHR
jgi:hypothetical protein